MGENTCAHNTTRGLEVVNSKHWNTARSFRASHGLIRVSQEPLASHTRVCTCISARLSRFFLRPWRQLQTPRLSAPCLLECRMAQIEALSKLPPVCPQPRILVRAASASSAL